jgi:hypothetical protein
MSDIPKKRTFNIKVLFMDNDIGPLAGDLYNLLSEKGLHVSRLTYFAGGGWTFHVNLSGGLFVGIILVNYDKVSDTISILKRKLFSTTKYEPFESVRTISPDVLLNGIFSLIMDITEESAKCRKR